MMNSHAIFYEGKGLHVICLLCFKGTKHTIRGVKNVVGRWEKTHCVFHSNVLLKSLMTNVQFC